MPGIHGPRQFGPFVACLQKHLSSQSIALYSSSITQLLSRLDNLRKCWAVNLISMSSPTLMNMYSTRPDVCILISTKKEQRKYPTGRIYKQHKQKLITHPIFGHFYQWNFPSVRVWTCASLAVRKSVFPLRSWHCDEVWGSNRILSMSPPLWQVAIGSDTGPDWSGRY